MSVNMSVRTPEGFKWRRVGTNGAQACMMALWFAAYAVASFSESTRVRSRWIEPQRTTPYGVTPAEYPIPYSEWTLVRGVKKLLAYAQNENGQDLAMVNLNEATMKRGLLLKPPTDPRLQALVEFYNHACREPWPDDIPAADAKRIAPVLAELLPLLEKNCWYDQMKEYSEIFALAAKCGVSVHIG